MTLRPRLIALAALAAAAATPARAQDLPVQEEDPWFQLGRETLTARKAVKPIKSKAKNVILFVGDGMDITTITAARIYDGQTRGEEGEENILSFERFPHAALAKTYNTDMQTPDSAGTMTAMVTGVKTKAGVISLSDKVVRGECDSAGPALVATLGEIAEVAGLATGVVSTTRLTHATPAAVFAHAPDRNWEADVDVPEGANCKDIARQLIEFPYGDGLEVAFGGGRRNFLPADLTDPEYADRQGRRKDGRDLATEWSEKSDKHVYAFSKDGFDAIEPGDGVHALALFERSHMKYEADRENDEAGEPSLAEMTTKAIDILSIDEDGYFLMVEAGRIDHAHHGGNAAHALEDTKALADAVAVAQARTNDNDTLIIVTADHGHTISFAGYPTKGNNILGLVDGVAGFPRTPEGYARAADGKPYTTLSYANGPGSLFSGDRYVNGRPTPTAQEVAAVNYRQQALVPGPSETHGGQDVTIYARGPHAYLFDGVVEQNYVFHVIEAALDLRRRAAKKR